MRQQDKVTYLVIIMTIISCVLSPHQPWGEGEVFYWNESPCLLGAWRESRGGEAPVQRGQHWVQRDTSLQSQSARCSVHAGAGAPPSNFRLHLGSKWSPQLL